ncbi:MAG: alpha/beta fold hydrolase [Candidatus Limnocylindrales bacterium]
MTEPTTGTLDVRGAVLTYDVRRNESSTKPVMLLIGLPMGAAGFGSLVGHFTDRTVVTYDPRGAERSVRTDHSTKPSLEEHADDLHLLISELGIGPVDLFASSGGAVSGLALVAHHPEDVRTLVAHEPPVAEVLPDRKEALAAVMDIYQTYQRGGFGPAMAKFIGIVSYKGPIPADFADQPAPDPAMFGMPTEDDGSRDDVMFEQTLRQTTHYQLDFDALRAASTTIVIAAGEDSEGILASRAAYVIAERLGTKVVPFPGDHGGFMGGEYGQPPGKPEEFAAALRKVLDV